MASSCLITVYFDHNHLRPSCNRDQDRVWARLNNKSLFLIHTPFVYDFRVMSKDLMRKMYPGTEQIPCLPLPPVAPWAAPTCLRVTALLQMKGFIHLAEPFCKIDRGKLTLDYYYLRLISCVRKYMVM